MKILLLTILSIAVLFISSCSDDDNGTNNNGNGGSVDLGTLQATVDGVSFKSISALGIDAGGFNITISGANQQFHTISLTVDENEIGSTFVGLGFYQILDINNPQNVQSWFSKNVEYTITKAENGVIEGTFSFVATNEDDNTTKTVTNGKFNVTVQNADF